jgi:hypothetical protein
VMNLEPMRDTRDQCILDGEFDGNVECLEAKVFLKTLYPRPILRALGESRPGIPQSSRTIGPERPKGQPVLHSEKRPESDCCKRKRVVANRSWNETRGDKTHQNKRKSQQLLYKEKSKIEKFILYKIYFYNDLLYL